MNILGNILQLSTAFAICIIFAYGLGPKSFTLVSTSKSSFTFLLTPSDAAGTTTSASGFGFYTGGAFCSKSSGFFLGITFSLFLMFLLIQHFCESQHYYYLCMHLVLCL